jgi:pimeloyl-ACP methyl ester carboxylesterase
VGLILLLLLVPAALLGQVRFLTFPSTIDSTDQPYAIYLPENFNPAQKYSLLVSLHTEDSNHRLNLRQVMGPPNRLGRPEHADPRFIIAFPYARGSMGYRGIAEQDVYDMIAAVERQYPVDPDRVYLTGASMGGGGALWLAATHPDRWAAVAVLCPATIPGTEELAPNLSNLPVRFYHGEQDTIVPAASSRDWQRRLLDIGVPMSYIEYPTLRHNAWDLAYRPGAAFDWLAQFRRNRSPAHVRFVSASYRYPAAYGVRIDGLTPGTPAQIDVQREGSRVVVETRNVDGFTVSLTQPATSASIDGATLRVRAMSSLSMVKTPNGWRPGHYTASGKHAGAEGPISEILAGRPIYVYGSLGTRTAAELDDRRKTAQTAATWSTARFRLDFAPVVKADSEVTDTDLASSDLVLLGTAATNSVLTRVAPQLPLALDPGAADYGLLYIAPVGNHYAMVSSGLPWWTGADDAGRHPYAFEPEPLALLYTFGDYILFKGSLAHIVSEGRFDRNWRLPADAAARMSATGTVVIR